MKKYLLAIACFFSVGFASAQIHKVALFDFHTLIGDTIKNIDGSVREIVNIRTVNLTPMLTFGQSSVLSISDTQFKSKDVTFVASRSTNNLWSEINQNISPNWCGISIPRFASLIFEVPEDCEIDSVNMQKMRNYSALGSMSVDTDNSNNYLGGETSFGIIDFGVWSARKTVDGKSVPIHGINRLTFFNGGYYDALISAIEVHYWSPADVLTYSTISPAIDEETDPFTGYKLTFDEEIKLQEGAEFVVKDADEEVVATLTAKVEGRVLTLTPEAPITKPGTYTLYVSTGAIRHKVDKNQEEYNKAFTATFSVKDHPDTFLYSDITTAEGKVKTLPQQIVMTFPSAIGSTTLETIDLMNDETVAKTATVSIDSKDATKLVLQFDADITEEGTYTLTFPENSIKAADEFHYNKALTLTYNVVNYDVPSAELVAKADSLLALTGVGYPKTNATARTTLVAVAAAKDSDVKAYTDAIAAYIATDDVMLPHYNKYYTIAKVASPDADTKNYIGYADEALVSTTAEADAHHFLFVDVEGDRCIQLADGKQMKIQLAKTVDAENPEKVFGLMDVTIEGFTDESEGAGYVLNQVFSPEPDYTPVITPVAGDIADVTRITVTIPVAESVKYNKQRPVQILRRKESILTPIDVITKPITTVGNTLVIDVNFVRDDTLVVSIPKGAISFYSIDHEIEVDSISVEYRNKYIYTFDYSIYNTHSTDTAHKSEEMNSMGFFSDTDLFINPERCVTYLQTLEGRNLFNGTLKKGEIFRFGKEYSLLTFDFGTEFNETNLPDGTYVFGIEKGSFGDALFGEYLNDPTPANKAKCKLNNVVSFIYMISNIETGINDLRNNGAATEIYDISGRRVAAPAKAGLYIIGGKKVIVK